jgi:diguanylate cyclase (GGDEF)-like protein
MDALLSPGTRLMRQFRVAGKFITIGLLLLVPVMVSLGGGWTAGSREIAFSQRERDGVRLAVPLVQLVAVLADLQADRGAVTGTTAVTPDQDDAARLRAVVDDVDAADAAVGAGLTVHDEWVQLRGQVLAADRTRALPVVQDFVERVAGASNLVLDPETDSHYVMLALVDRLPQVLVSAARCEQRLRREGEPEPEPMLGHVAERLRKDLATAGSAAGGDGLTRQFAATSAALDAALAPYLRAAGQAPGQGTVRDLGTVAAAGAALADSLGSALDTLLHRRESELAAGRRQPLLIVGLALACAGYLGLALYRATIQDVHTLLAEVNQVTSGEPNARQPLPGRDEFAQLSRALRDAGDRLTELLSALRLQATHDELIGLPNRTMFMSKLEEAIAVQPGRFAVVLADLDRFKDLNDSFGPGMGDRLLRVVGARVHKAAGRRNLVARLGGNEFAVLVCEATVLSDVQQVIDRIKAALAEPVDLDGRQLHVRPRMGVALHATDRPGAVDLIRNAAVALSAAKDRDGWAATLFEPAMHERTRDRTELSGDLVTAVSRQQLSLVYQPIVEVASGTVRGVEALVRWVHPTRGPVSPAVFIPLAEASGQIVELGRWVLHEALRQLAAWHRQFPDGYPLTMDINLSAGQLADPGLPGEVLELISRTGVDPHRVVLEITESALVREMEAVLRRLGQLSATGVRLALDDFGTGYSSLSYLRRLPVSVLKVDKSFIDDLDSPDGQAARLLHDIVGLGAGLGMEVIAEGIESPAQVPALRAAGCHLVQGYLWSQPIDAEQVARLLRSGGRIEAPGSTPDAAGLRPGLHLPRQPGPRPPGPREPGPREPGPREPGTWEPGPQQPEPWEPGSTPAPQDGTVVEQD